jgi:two-component system chemotaxis response regulator CheB
MVPTTLASAPTYDAVVIGASAGAIEALLVILPALPRNYELAVLVCVHLPATSRSLLPELFGARCALSVCEPEDKQPIQRGTIYFAPPDYHLLVERERVLSLSVDNPVHYSRPSIDLLFESAAASYRERLVGVILSGANQDGAEGLWTVVQKRGLGIVQEPSGAYATRMPLAAIERARDVEVLELPQIAARLSALTAIPRISTTPPAS